MTERITNERLNNVIKNDKIPPIPTHAAALDYALDLRDARRERDDARLHAADFVAETEQLRARVKELEDQAREYGDGLKPVAAGYYDGIKVQRKYNALREAVRKKRQLLDTRTICPECEQPFVREDIEDLFRLTEGGGQSREGEAGKRLSETRTSDNRPALKRKPKAYLTRHDLEDGSDE